MATMINKINDAEVEQEILNAMNFWVETTRNLQQFRGENPLLMESKRARAYNKAQRKATEAELEIYEYARIYPSIFRKLTKSFKVK